MYLCAGNLYLIRLEYIYVVGEIFRKTLIIDKLILIFNDIFFFYYIKVYIALNNKTRRDKA